MSIDTSSHRAFILSVMEQDGAFIADDYLVDADGKRCATVYTFLGDHLQINSLMISGVILYNDGRMVLHDSYKDQLVEVTS